MQNSQISNSNDISTTRNEVIDGIRDVISALWQRKLFITLITLLTLALGILFILQVKPLYMSTSQVFIDPRSKGLVENEISPSGLGRSSIGADLLLLETQIELIQSDSLLGRVLAMEEEAGLAPEEEEPSFVRTIINSAKDLLKSSDDAGIVVDPIRRRLIDLREAMEVQRAGNTYIVDISILDEDRDRATRLANDIASQYILELSNVRVNASRDNSSALGLRVRQLEEDVRKAENSVTQFLSDNGLIGTGWKTPVDDEQLTTLNTRLMSQRAETSTQRARYEQLKAATNSSEAIGNTFEAIQSQVVSSLRLQLADIARREADIKARLSDRHPSVEALRSERTELQSQLASELNRILGAAKTNYDRALEEEQALEAMFAELSEQALVNNRSFIKLRELQRDVETSRRLLDQFLFRSKQSAEEEELSNETARIVTSAIPPIDAVFPRKKVVLAASLLAGLLLGSIMAWLHYILTGNPAQKEQDTDIEQQVAHAQPQPKAEPAPIASVVAMAKDTAEVKETPSPKTDVAFTRVPYEPALEEVDFSPLEDIRISAANDAKLTKDNKLELSDETIKRIVQSLRSDAAE